MLRILGRDGQNDRMTGGDATASKKGGETMFSDLGPQRGPSFLVTI